MPMKNYLSSAVMVISLTRQAATIPSVVLPFPIWQLKMQGVEAGSCFRDSTMVSMYSVGIWTNQSSVFIVIT